MRIKKLILISLLLLLAVSAKAGLEPFYQGEWGMSRAQIKALHAAQPILTKTEPKSKIVYIEYDIEILDRPAKIRYYFGTFDQLAQVWLSIATPKVTGVEAVAFIKNLCELISQAGPFEHCRVSTDGTKKADVFVAQWINAETFVDLTATITAKSKTHMIYLDLWDNRSNALRPLFEELQAKAGTK